MFENILGIGENAGDHHFPLFPHCYQPLPFVPTFLSSANTLNLDQSKILSSGKGFKGEKR